MTLKKAELSDFAKLTEFYKFAIENTRNMTEYGRWIYGVYPTDEIIRGYVENGYMFYSEDNGEIAAAVAVTPFQSADYHAVQWSVTAEDDEVAVVHILCINPQKQKCGLAKSVMNEIISMSKKSKKAVRLDALCCNKPAQKLYESIGFKKQGSQRWFADNTGWIDFFLYEYVC